MSCNAPQQPGTVRQRTERHIPAPFDLRKDIGILSEPANMEFFKATFPGNTGYMNDELFLYIYHDAPPQPPPKTFAGVPVLFVDPGTEPFPGPMPFPYPLGFFVPSRQGYIGTHLNVRDDDLVDWSPVFHVLRDHFERIHVPITEVIYWRCFVHIVLEDENTDRERLPCRAVGLMCTYLFEKDMQRPEQGQPDNTNAASMRPARDQHVEVLDGAANETRLQRYDVVHLHTDTGVLEGHAMAFSRRKILVDNDVNRQDWVVVDWIYPGVDANPFPRMHGAAVYDGREKVVSNFQYVFHEGPWKGWCVGTSV